MESGTKHAAGITLLSTEHTIRYDAESSAALLKGFTQENEGVDGFWIHLDADILDAAIMLCLDCPEPDGLQWEDLKITLWTPAFMQTKVCESPNIYYRT